MYPRFIAVGFTLYLNPQLKKICLFFKCLRSWKVKLLTPNSRRASKNREVVVGREKKKGKKKESRQKQPLLEKDFVWGLGRGEMLLAHRLSLREAGRFSAASQGAEARSAHSIGATAQGWDKSETTTQQWWQNLPLQYRLSWTCQTLVSLRGAPVFSTPRRLVSNVYFRPGTVYVCAH